MQHNPLFALFFFGLLLVLSVRIIPRKHKQEARRIKTNDAALPAVQAVERHHYPATLNTAIVYDESYVDITKTHYRVIIPKSEKLFSGVKFTAQGQGFIQLSYMLSGVNNQTITGCVKTLTQRGATVQQIEMIPGPTLNGKRNYDCNVRFFHPPGCRLVKAKGKK